MDISSIANLLAGDGVASLSEKTGADEAQVSQVLGAALPMLMKNLQQNASSEEGAASLEKALDRHSGADLSNIAGFLQNTDAADGEKILGHILGGSKAGATQELSAKSGLSSGQVTTILSSVAPLLLSSLGNEKKTAAGKKGSSTDLMGTLLGSVLGGDDGELGLDDLAGVAMKVLGGNSGKKPASGKKPSASKKDEGDLAGALLSGLSGLLKG